MGARGGRGERREIRTGCGAQRAADAAAAVEHAVRLLQERSGPTWSVRTPRRARTGVGWGLANPFTPTSGATERQYLESELQRQVVLVPRDRGLERLSRELIRKVERLRTGAARGPADVAQWARVWVGVERLLGRANPPAPIRTRRSP